MRRAERKLELSDNVVGEDLTDREGKEMAGAKSSDLRSIIFGLHMFDPTEITNEVSDQSNLPKLSAMVDKVIALRNGEQSEKDGSMVEINPVELINDHDHGKGQSSVSFDPGFDEASYLSWVEKFKEVAQSKDYTVLEVGNRRRLPEEKHMKAEEARKKAEEKKLLKWETLGYSSLAVKDPVSPVDRDIMSDSGSVHFVYGDCTQPSKVCSSEPTIIFR